MTLDSDWARFTEQDLDEATARLRRLAQVMAWRLQSLSADWDFSSGDEWTLRKIAQHVAEACMVYATRPPANAVQAPPAET